MAEQRESSKRETVTEVEFRTEDPTYPLVSITGRTECRARLEQIVPRKDNAYAEYFSVTGVEPERAMSVAREYDGLEVSLLHADGEELAAELGVSPPTFFEHLRIAQRKIVSVLRAETSSH